MHVLALSQLLQVLTPKMPVALLIAHVLFVLHLSSLTQHALDVLLTEHELHVLLNQHVLAVVPNEHHDVSPVLLVLLAERVAAVSLTEHVPALLMTEHVLFARHLIGHELHMLLLSFAIEPQAALPASCLLVVAVPPAACIGNQIGSR